MLAPFCKQYDQTPSRQEEKTYAFMKEEYNRVMNEDIINVVEPIENQLSMKLSSLDIMHYYNSEGADVVSCFDEQPFFCVSSVERGGTIQRYKVAIASEVYDLKVLHVKNKCPVPLSSYYKGGFGRVEQLSLQGFRPCVKKIMRVVYPDYVQETQNQKETMNKSNIEPVNNGELPEQLPYPLTVTQILREYCIAKLAGAYGYGPQVLKSGDFDLIFYADYAEYVLEACVPLVQHLLTKADRKDCEKIKRRMKHCVLHMHKHRLVHLDIKPHNFLYSPSRQNYVLSDFGTARAVSNEAGLQTSHKSNICSPHYSSDQFREKVQGLIQGPIDLYYQDVTGLVRTFGNLDGWATEKQKFSEVKKYPPPTDAVSDRQTVERLAEQLSCFSRGQIPPFQDPLPNSYEWIAQYYPEFKNCRMDEPQLPREICLLERAISLNFNLLDYSYPLQISPKTMNLQMRLESEAYSGDNLKRLEFCSQKYHLGRLLERMKTRVEHSCIKVWLAFLDFQMLNPTMYTIQDIKRFYANIEEFRNQELSEGQNMTMWRIAQEITMRKFYIDVLERKISIQEMERFTQETWFGPPESLFSEKFMEGQFDMERSRETIGPERYESVPESVRPLDNYDFSGFHDFVDDRLNREQYSEYVRNQGLQNLSISSIASNKGVTAYSDEQRKEKIEASFAMLVALLFSKKEYERSRYLIGKISNPSIKRQLVFTKLQLEERLYGCEATLRLVKNELEQAKQESTIDQQLVVILSSRQLALKSRGKDYPEEKTPEEYQSAPYHHLREQATRFYSAGNYEKSLELFRQCAFTVRLNDPRSETHYYELLAWQGQLLILMGEEREGFALLNRATEAVRMSEGPKSNKLAICYIQFGKSYKELVEDPEALIKAIRYFKDAIDILEEKPPRCCMSFIQALKEKGSCHELLYSRYSMKQNLVEAIRTHEKALLYPMYKSLADMSFRTQIYEALSVCYFRQKQWNKSLRCMLKHFQTFELLKKNGGYREGMVTPAQTVRKLNCLLINCVNLHGNLQKINNVRRQISRRLKMFAAVGKFAQKDRQELIKKEKTHFAVSDLIKQLWDMLDEIKNFGFKSLKDLTKAKRLRMFCLIIKPSNAELVDPKVQQDLVANIKKHKFQ